MKQAPDYFEWAERRGRHFDVIDIPDTLVTEHPAPEDTAGILRELQANTHKAAALLTAAGLALSGE